MAPPGYMSKQAKTGNMARERRMSEGSYDAAIRAGLIVTGSPKTIIQKFKHIVDRTDPGYLTFWAREGKKPHDATMRGIELLGQEVIPALREHRSALVTSSNKLVGLERRRSSEVSIRCDATNSAHQRRRHVSAGGELWRGR